MRVENVFCEECGVPHFVEVVQRERTTGRIIKTRCHGKDFLPIQSNPVLNDKPRIIKHSLRGYNIILKTKPEPRKRLPTTFKRERVIAQPIVMIDRVCVAELSMFVRGKFVTIKVFEDATPDKFYEFFYEVTDKPAMVKPRHLGHNKSIHIGDIPNIYKIEGKINLVIHNKPAYEKLLTVDPNAMSTILGNNMLVSSSRR